MPEVELRGRPVAVAGVGLLCPAGIGVEGALGGRPGPVPGFRAHAYVDDRKKLKLMGRSVQLGVAAIRLSLAGVRGWDQVPPERRGMFVGATPQAGDADDLRPALEAGVDGEGALSLQAFAERGYPLIHPLWLVKGLSNNILGFASAIHDFQGVNMNYCDEDEGGWTALCEGAQAVSEGRADVVVAGGADALVEAETLFGGRRCGEGAAFLVLRPALPTEVPLVLDRGDLSADEHLLGYLGAATWPVAVARRLLRPEAGIAQSPDADGAVLR